uniref:Si:dkey-23a23.2 n=1 Tax=Cyprinus carpio TaxID=7962 RepID=A0A8C1S358_CYPCA
MLTAEKQTKKKKQTNSSRHSSPASDALTAVMMMERENKRSAERKIVHCLQCYKPQKTLSVHLARVCMKKSTAEERAEQVKKAKASSREWIWKNRTWNYEQLCALLPDRRSRIAMVKELLRRGFFIMNQPEESDMVLDPEGDSASDDGATESSGYPLTVSHSVRSKMKEAGLHNKFPAQAKLLVDFKKYLIVSKKVLNWKQEVDNVSRFLRYLQPTGIEPSLDFLSKTKEAQDFLTALKRTDMSSATVHNYIKSMNRFLEYLTLRLDFQKRDPQLRTNCQRYTKILETLWKTVLKSHDEKTSDSRPEGTPCIKDCQKILREAKPDFLWIHENLLMGKKVSNTEKTLYRYYCEALLVFRHMQLPGAVEGLTDADWVERIAQGGRVVIGVRKEKTASMQIALTQDEEACFQLYYKEIRPKNIGLKKFCQSFFTSTSGNTVHSVSQDMNRLHEMYKLTPIRSYDVRRAFENAAEKLPAHQHEAVIHYLAHSASADRRPQPQDIVDAALLLDFLKGTSSDDDTSLAELSTAGTKERYASRKDFSAFLDRFPVLLEGQPPTKRQRVDSGFPEDRVFYDKWRAAQYTQREEYLLSQFTHCKPSASKVARLIVQEGWKANYPKPEEIQRLWKPASTDTIEADELIIKCVFEQAWTGLAIKDFGAEEGLGVVATRPFSKGDIVCDYHGKVIRAAEGMAMMEGHHDEARYLFFFKTAQRDLCIDARTGCDCHPDTDTVGRRIKCCSKRPNLEPLHCVMKVNGEDQDVILFKALQDISIDTQLKFYSGAIRKSFLGLDLDWLDE